MSEYLLSINDAGILYDRRQEVFFEDKLKLDYSTERGGFRLAGPGQIYMSGMPLVDRRSVQ